MESKIVYKNNSLRNDNIVFRNFQRMEYFNFKRIRSLSVVVDTEKKKLKHKEIIYEHLRTGTSGVH